MRRADAGVWEMFGARFVFKGTCADAFEGKEVSPVEVRKRAKEEWKRWRKRGEKERGGLKGL